MGGIMIDQAATAFAWTLGVLLALVAVATVAVATHQAWVLVRYTRAGWWLHRRLPTRTGRW
jgi:hypothetical protein